MREQWRKVEGFGGRYEVFQRNWAKSPCIWNARPARLSLFDPLP